MVYDPDLTINLPVAISVTSGINAVAHAVEALYAKDRNPLISLLAEEAIRAFARSLPIIVANPKDESGRSMRSTALGWPAPVLDLSACRCTTTLPCLGGAYNLPHAERTP